MDTAALRLYSAGLRPPSKNAQPKSHASARPREVTTFADTCRKGGRVGVLRAGLTFSLVLAASLLIVGCGGAHKGGTAEAAITGFDGSSAGVTRSFKALEDSIRDEPSELRRV